MRARIGLALLLATALPLALDSTTGCSFSAPAASVPRNAYVCACSCSPGQRHRSLRVSFNEDDAEQRLSNTGFDVLLDSPDLDFLNGRYVGLRFRNVEIPKGATILAANVQFTSAPTSTTGSLTVAISGQAADNAAPFMTIAGSLGALPTTAAAVSWNMPNWPTLGVAGADQATPNVKSIVQEIVNRPGWVSGNSLVLLFRGTAGSALRKAFTREGRIDGAASLDIEYEEPAPTAVGPQELPICLPPSSGATEAELAADCEGRVQNTISGLAEACNYPSDCHCGMQTNATSYSQSLLWADKCDLPCDEEPVDVQNDCKNFDPVNGLATATNAAGDQPVCAAYSPLSSEVYGRRSTCAVEGNAQVSVEDETKNPGARGVVHFVGKPCPGGTCAVGVQYNLDIDNVTFGNFFHSETFRELGGIGETAPGQHAMVTSTGDATLAPDTAGVAARGRRGSDLKGLATTNGDTVNAYVGWASSTPTCSLNGTVIGNVDPELKRCDEGPDAGVICEDDSGCTQSEDCSDEVCNCVAQGRSDMTLTLDVDGALLNQPPTANAGADQTVECTTAAITNVTLDASASSDPDSNLALYSWLRGGRAGKQVGFDEVSQVEQPLGSRSYILRVIDSMAQADEDIVNVNVVDTTPPEVTCAVASAVIGQNNHELINVSLSATAVDQCEGALPVRVKVYGDEDDEDNTGDGRYSPDAKDLAVGTLRLRAERKGDSDGRVYLIVSDATDSSGNRGFNCCTVVAPLSNAASSQLSAYTQAAAARAYCHTHQGTAPAGFFIVGDGSAVGPKQ